MKKGLVAIAVFFVFCVFLYAQTESLIISRTDSFYEDFYMMANDGLITSVEASHFKYNPISSYEAAFYVVEAAGNLLAASPKVQDNYTATLKKYYETYRKKAFEIYGKSVETKKKLARAMKAMKDPGMEEYKAYIEEASLDIYDIEDRYKETTYRGIPPFKVQGMLTARWQDVETFGVAPVHHTSLGGTFMQLWTEGVITNDINFKLNITFEKPWNEAEKKAGPYSFPEFWGTGQRFLDKYTINIGAYGWSLSSGFFWEDITPFIAKSILSNRPALFDRDPYALEETSMGHYENAFLHSFVARGDIWSKHGFMGVGIYNNDFFGTKGMLKLMAGKAEKFDEMYDKYYLYEYAGRYLQPISIDKDLEIALAANFFHTSNELAEIITMNPPPVNDYNFPQAPYGYIKAQTIAGGDTKINIYNLFETSGEFEISNYHGFMRPFPPPDYYAPRINMIGTASYAQIKAKQPFTISGKYTKIDPTYIADASAIIDTAFYKIDTSPGGDIRHGIVDWDSYSGDPTLLYNNTQRMDLFTSIPIPAGFLNLTYGSASQINPTSNLLYVDHFVVGNRLTGPMWWHMFFSSYGYPDLTAGGMDGYAAYNDGDYPFRGAITSSQYKGKRYIFTQKWLTNKEMIVLDQDPRPDPVTGKPVRTKKFTNNASAELKLQLNKIFGLQNNLFLQGYFELVSVWPGSDLMVTYGDKGALFTQNLISSFIYYNITRKMGIMFEACIERWYSDNSVAYDNGNPPRDANDKPIYTYKPINYLDNSFGLGFDYDFAPRTALYLRAKRFFHQDLYYGKYKVGNEWRTQDFDGWFLLMEVKNFF